MQSKQMKQHANIKQINQCHSFTITSPPAVADYSGDGSTITVVPLDALSIELSIAFASSNWYSSSLTGLVPKAILSCKGFQLAASLILVVYRRLQFQCFISERFVCYLIVLLLDKRGVLSKTDTIFIRDFCLSFLQWSKFSRK